MSRYRHIVLFWLKDASPAGIAEAREKLLSLQGRIPGLVSLEAYRTHPAHLPVIAFMKEPAAKACTADYPVR